MRILLIGSSYLVHTTRLQQVEKKQSAVTVFGPPPNLGADHHSRSLRLLSLMEFLIKTKIIALRTSSQWLVEAYL